jgi:hypothetical protein
MRGGGLAEASAEVSGAMSGMPAATHSLGRLKARSWLAHASVPAWPLLRVSAQAGSPSWSAGAPRIGSGESLRLRTGSSGSGEGDSVLLRRRSPCTCCIFCS